MLLLLINNSSLLFYIRYKFYLSFLLLNYFNLGAFFIRMSNTKLESGLFILTVLFKLDCALDNLIKFYYVYPLNILIVFYIHLKL